jgi:membrane protein
MTKDHVGTYASQASFFMLLSLFPLAMLILTLVGFTNIPQTTLQDMLLQIIPSQFDELICQLLDELYSSASGALVSVTAVSALWAASKSVMSILLGLNEIYHHNQNRNWFFLRFISIIYTILFIFIFVLMLVFLVFGNTIVSFIKKRFPALTKIALITISWRAIVALLILVTFFLLVYMIVRNKEYHFFHHLPGSIFSASGWMIFSFFFSIYVENASNYTYIYGSMTTVILVMLWVYALMYILFIGAEINVFFKKYDLKFLFKK